MRVWFLRGCFVFYLRISCKYFILPSYLAVNNADEAAVLERILLITTWVFCVQNDRCFRSFISAWSHSSCKR